MNRPEPVTLGLIGFGTLARHLVAACAGDDTRWVALVRHGSSAVPSNRVRLVDSLEDLIAARPWAVVEVAGPESVARYGPGLLRAGIPLVAASVGAFADQTIAHQLAEARQASGTRLVIPSGAIGGLDYLAAVARLPDVWIRYRLRKPFAAWRDELQKRGLFASQEPVVLFDGSPDEAVRLYPQNLNAAFTVALTVHPSPCRVEVIADPTATDNVHEIEVTSSAGQASFRFVNTPSVANPKTSVVTALSLEAALRNLLAEGVKH